GLEPRLLGEGAEDEERARTRQRAAAGVEEELAAVPPVEVRAAPGEIAAERLGCVAPDRHDALLAALADHADEAAVEVDTGALEPDGLGDAEAGPVEQLDERLVTQRAGLCSVRRGDQPLGFAGRQRLRERPDAPRQADGGRRVVLARAEQLLVAEEAARRGGTAGDRRRGEAVGAELRRVALQILDRRTGDRL